MAVKNEKTKKEEIAESLLPPRAKKSTQDAGREGAPKKEQKKRTQSEAKTKESAKGTEKEAKKDRREPRPIDENSVLFQLVPYLYGFAAFLTVLCFALPDKMAFLGEIGNFLRGLFSYAAWLIPLLLLNQAFFWHIDAPKHNLMLKFVFSLVCLVFASVIVQMFFVSSVTMKEFGEFYKLGVGYRGGGFVGSLVGCALYSFAGYGAVAIALFVLIVIGLFLFGMTPADVFFYFKNSISESIYDARKRRSQRPRHELFDDDTDFDPESQSPVTIKEREHASKEIKEVPLPDYEKNIQDEDELSGRVDALYDAPQAAGRPREDDTESKTGEIDLEAIFSDDAVIHSAGKSMSADGTAVSKTEEDENGMTAQDGETEENEEESGEIEIERGKLILDPKPTCAETYKFPSTDFLTKAEPLTFDVTNELRATSIKLVETLANFGVKTKITHISCGPTVTRYELSPEVGVRVRSIQNLSEDIALHLAAKGVRIEAPIPGKDAVGIEIPNKTPSTVYIRDLIDDPAFYELKSRVSFCLGMDVAGNPVYMDMAKMPHLLIAGATGMGKSVCINSFIVSILYKARPDEVKLILIDPKKVELGIYNGIPHLLVPVVSEPKKAAGSLAWAVNEMERRFMLIEEVGVRDLASYNRAVANDPEKEVLPQIIIIIDELADLMMTAKDDVETSICRLAQKARAAGMHIIIGTQRPSVDVITGVIKANVPSRIAFTVASQVDSRTIIDVAGADKLMGRGDMLFAPVGCMKPIRVQGAFVSEDEIEKITDFLKNGRNAEYDAEIIDSIEKEAQKCGEKKKGRGESELSDGMPIDSPDSDPMILPAIGVAVESGQLSTSLLQRRLSLGYARAARIVDTLEQMGIIGPFEGSKPRKVLITMEQYLEMKSKLEETK